MRKTNLLLLVMLLFGISFVQAQNINTIAGNGTASYSGDGGLATAASINLTYGTVFDASGNIYFSDTQNQRIRKITTDGKISTIAGTGTAGNTGDGGAAIDATLRNPEGLAIDASGNIYVACLGGHVIRKITTDGKISTIAGTAGSAGFSGDGGAATSATLNFPRGIAVDASGNIYFSDTQNHRIRKITTDGIINTIAGTGVGYFSGDGEAATSATLFGPNGIAVDASGNIYIADANNSRIRKITTDGIINTIAGTGTPGFSGDGGDAIYAQIKNASDVALDGSGNIYIADAGNNRIRKITTDGKIKTIAGTGTAGFSGDGGAATSANFNMPFNVSVDASGNIYVHDRVNYRIRKIDACNDGKLATANTNTTYASQSTTAYLYTTCSGGIIATVKGAATGGASGSTKAYVWIDATQNVQYVKRHYEINPTTNGGGTVTLYFTQAEFDAYNSAKATATPALPTGAGDATGIGNLRVKKYAGNSGTTPTGKPADYTGAQTTIDPNDADIVWNATDSRWEVTFYTPGFSGFFVSTNGLFLPVSFGEITARLNSGMLSVQFTTEMEKNNSHFDIEVSKDGQNFTKVTTISSQHKDGNSSQPTIYNAIINKNVAASYLSVGLLLFGALLLVAFNRKNKIIAMAMVLLAGVGFGVTSCNKAEKELAYDKNSNLFVRIAQVDKDGTVSYSKVVKVVAE